MSGAERELLKMNLKLEPIKIQLNKLCSTVVNARRVDRAGEVDILSPIDIELCADDLLVILSNYTD